MARIRRGRGSIAARDGKGNSAPRASEKKSENAPAALVQHVRSQGRRTSSPARSPCRKATSTIVSVAVAIVTGGDDQTIDLGVGQILARAKFGVAPTARRLNCPVYAAFPTITVPNKAPNGTLHNARNADFIDITAISGAATSSCVISPRLCRSKRPSKRI
jgi:hypothetical protein